MIQKLKMKFIKSIATVLGYEIVMIRYHKNKTYIGGHDNVIRHLDIQNLSKQKLIKRRYRVN